MLFVIFVGLCVFVMSRDSSGGQAKSPGPVIVVETTRGAFEFETYPGEAPKTVAHIVALVKRGFYDGQRFHRALPGFLIQWGDPRSREPARDAEWGRGAEASSGEPIGSAEITKKRTHLPGAVGVAHPGDPAAADSQIYVTLANRPDLDGSVRGLRPRDGGRRRARPDSAGRSDHEDVREGIASSG